MGDGNSDEIARLQAFIDGYLDSLQRLPDDEVVDANQAMPPGGAPFAELVEKARMAAGRRRLQRARRMLDQREPTGEAGQVVDVAEARRFIAKAVNNPRFTLAARDLESMSDEDVLRIYRQLRDLGAEPTPKKP
jgi:hypothetical protein